jgi:hypothetical protein
VLLSSADDFCSWLDGIAIAEEKRREAGSTLDPPVVAFAQLAVLEEFAPVPGAEVVPKRRGLLLAVRRRLLFAVFKDRSNGKDDEKEGKGANQQLGSGEVEHGILLCIGGALRPEGT